MPTDSELLKIYRDAAVYARFDVTAKQFIRLIRAAERQGKTA